MNKIYDYEFMQAAKMIIAAAGASLYNAPTAEDAHKTARMLNLCAQALDVVARAWENNEEADASAKDEAETGKEESHEA